MNRKNKLLLLFLQTYQKAKELPYVETSRYKDQTRKKSLFMEKSLNNDSKSV